MFAIQKKAVVISRFFVFNVLIYSSITSDAQISSFVKSDITNYESSLNILSNLLFTNGSFKKSVFIVEKTFDTSLKESEFNEAFNLLYKISNSYVASIKVVDYNQRDKSNFLENIAVYKTIHDTTFAFVDTSFVGNLHFTYSFTDPLGRQDWSNMFVTKLLATHQGNCHSLAYLYKILADEVGAKCWLSLAPNHIYIKNYSEKIGWYNTELTSGTFPTDAWVMVTGYVNPEAIKSGLYMDTLSNQQSIALCVLDLAKEYEFQTHNYYDGFILKCCDLVLQYHSVNPMALLLKAETLKKIYLHEREMQFPKPTVTFNEMQNAYITLAKLGYREMPEKMYQQWLTEMTTEKEKYTNKKVTTPTTKK